MITKNYPRLTNVDRVLAAIAGIKMVARGGEVIDNDRIRAIDPIFVNGGGEKELTDDQINRVIRDKKLSRKIKGRRTPK